MQGVLAEMSKLERTTVRMHANGYTYDQIAQAIKGNHKTVDNALQRAREKFENAEL